MIDINSPYFPYIMAAYLVAGIVIMLMVLNSVMRLRNKQKQLKKLEKNET